MRVYSHLFPHFEPHQNPAGRVDFADEERSPDATAPGQEPGSPMSHGLLGHRPAGTPTAGGNCTHRQIFIQLKTRTFCHRGNICIIQKKVKEKILNAPSRDNQHCILDFPPKFSF